MFKLFHQQEKIEGAIAYYHLQDWWLHAFTQEERSHIESVFHPLGTDPKRKPLTEGKIEYSSQNAAGLLHALAGWFNNPQDRHIAHKIIEKANELAQSGSDALTLHFTLQQEIDIYYRERNNDPAALGKAIKACEEQIRIAPQAAQQFLQKYPIQRLPRHVGYSQLAIILKKQGNYQRVIELCEQAKKQGWAGDWDKRIAEANQKLDRQ